ncbi:MAG: organic solvent ABC transporter ATP-binding protein [Verrucomicrobia bacterium]|nr:organic solvent ABC transporter ATP-binding protein [Verrucomicrobiota bacterium]
MSAPGPVLSVFEAVPADTAGRGALPPLTFDLAPGALALLEAADPAWIPAVGDLFCGFSIPASGRVEFEGQPWTAGAPGVQAARRARIGRVFAGTAWIGNLDVDENVVLAQLYHGDRPAADLRAAADDLARRFGLAGIPAGRPAWADPRELQAAQWVRAWLGKPALFVLEEPAAGVTPRTADALCAVLRESLAAGAAAVWITERVDPRLTGALEPAVRLAMDGSSAAG